ncbi:MAG: 50S ribosomal protein L31, partial [Candidatus Nealsonbacteria bacterium]|nr:50S ribosomal protein L31 [Candidatus Nealsonbacteria bacterium]
EICSKCHPFYTGKSRVIDTMGRVDKFKKKLEKKEQLATKKKAV